MIVTSSSFYDPTQASGFTPQQPTVNVWDAQFIGPGGEYFPRQNTSYQQPYRFEGAGTSQYSFAQDQVQQQNSQPRPLMHTARRSARGSAQPSGYYRQGGAQSQVSLWIPLSRNLCNSRLCIILLSFVFLLPLSDVHFPAILTSSFRSFQSSFNPTTTSSAVSTANKSNPRCTAYDSINRRSIPTSTSRIAVPGSAVPAPFLASPYPVPIPDPAIPVPAYPRVFPESVLATRSSSCSDPIARTPPISTSGPHPSESIPTVSTLFGAVRSVLPSDQYVLCDEYARESECA